MSNLSTLADLERIERGIRISRNSPYDPEALSTLAREQIALLNDESVIIVPADVFPSEVLWPRGCFAHQLDLNAIRDETALRPLDEFIERLWRRIHDEIKPEVAISPIFIKPCYEVNDLRNDQGKPDKTTLEGLLSEPFIIAAGGTGGNNVLKLYRGFEQVSAGAIVTTAVRMAIALDLKGIEVTFNDPQFNTMVVHETIFNPSQG